MLEIQNRSIIAMTISWTPHLKREIELSMPHPEHSLGDLAKLALAGDYEALSEMSDMVVRCALVKARQMGQGLDAEDLAQRIALKVFMALPKLTLPTTNCWALVHMIARNEIIDHIRWQRSHRLHFVDSLNDLDGTGDELPAPDEDPLISLALQECMRLLPEQERVAVMLVRLSGWTLEEAAAQTGIPLTTLQRRVTSGVRKLSECIKNDSRIV